MIEYIARDAVIKESTFMFDEALGHCKCVLVEDIEKVPAADVAEVKHGEWHYVGKMQNTPTCVCSECNHVYPVYSSTEYCQHCGAKMNKKEV
jgi:NADH pyrophosphatase NudC (nudix superfamily)